MSAAYEAQRDDSEVVLKDFVEKNSTLGQIDRMEKRADKRFDRLESDVSDIKDRVGGLETDVAVIKCQVGVLQTDVGEVKGVVNKILEVVNKDKGAVDYKSAQWKTAGIAIGILAAIAGAVLQILQLTV